MAMRAGLAIALVPVVVSWVPPEFVGAKSTEEKFNIVSTTDSESLLRSLPKELSGENMTLDNFYKWFNLTGYVEFRRDSPLHSKESFSEPPKNVSGWNPLDLVNVFKDVWDIVKHGKAVVNFGDQDYSCAIPKGVAWQDIAFDHDPTLSGTYHFYWKNPFGVQCSHIDFRIHRYCHGVYDGQSQHKYMTQVTQIVDSVAAGFGVSLNAHAATSPPTNVGSSDAVLSEITMNIYTDSEVDANTRNQINMALSIRGDGTMSELMTSADVVELSSEVLV